MVYTSGAVSIDHEGVARVFYSKQKPRVCTINHKPRHGTTVLYNAIAQGLIWARIVHVAIRLRRGATRLHMPYLPTVPHSAGQSRKKDPCPAVPRRGLTVPHF